MALVAAPRPLADANWRRLERIRQATFAAVMAQWQTGDFPLDTAVQVVLAAQAAAVGQTDGYVAAAATVVLETQVDPVGLDPRFLTGARARHGVPLEEVYGRVAKAAREEGMQRGMAMLRQSITTDVALAQRNASNAAMEANRAVAGWRRVLNPGGGQVCGMCVAASTRVYRRGDLQPIHRMCRCTTRPIYDTSFTGRTLDRERLQAVYARSGGSTEYKDLARIRFRADELPAGVDSEALDALNVRVVADRELGPMLDADRHDTHFAISA